MFSFRILNLSRNIFRYNSTRYIGNINRYIGNRCINITNYSRYNYSQQVLKSISSNKFTLINAKNNRYYSESKFQSHEKSKTSSSIMNEELPSEIPSVSFKTVWDNLETKFGGMENISLPREIIWLGGAPGSGKGTNSPFIMKQRHITAFPIVMSKLAASSPEMKEIMDRGDLVSDSFVFNLLLNELLDPKYANGAIVDGFPRTNVQVEYLNLLSQKMDEIHKKYGMDIDGRYPRPHFRIACLFVDEEVSVKRQLKRGFEVHTHNEKVKATGVGELLPERVTDTDENYSRYRYSIFKKHFSTLQSLAKYFPFHLINASGTIEEVQEFIAKQFEYQSSQDLDESLYNILYKRLSLPLAKEATANARSKLVSRLERWSKKHSNIFKQVVDELNILEPKIMRLAISGESRVLTENPIFQLYPESIEMALDVLAERGYLATYYGKISYKPVKFDLETGNITNEKKKDIYFLVRNNPVQVRN